MILVVTHKPSLRLKYVLDFISSMSNGLQLKMISVLDWSQGSRTPYISYGMSDNEDTSLHIPSSGLLEEEHINQYLDTSWNQKANTFSFALGNDGVDVFGAMFFMLSRYEEYFETELDQFGRYQRLNSALVQADEHQKPWVDIWARDFLQKIDKELGTEYEKNIKSNIEPTMDIDIAFEYLGRNLRRTLGGTIKDFAKPKRLLERMQVYFSLKKDPAFIFKELPQGITYFVHVGEEGPLDKNCGLSRKDFQAFLQQNRTKSIGLHPSFQSHLDIDELIFELEQLEVISDLQITKTRQHYIKLKLPYTYELIKDLGMEKDYSMGWPDKPGYRAGTNHPFYFFNLRTNEQTKLKIQPFTWMDTHFIFHENKVQEMENQFHKYWDDVKEYGGVFTPIFHNNHFQHYPNNYNLLKELCK